MNQIECWAQYLTAERRFSPLTVRAYTDDLKAFADYLEGVDPVQAEFSDLRSYVMIQVERGDNPRSINRHVSALRSFFRFLVRSGAIERDPTTRLRTLPEQHNLPEFISQKQIEPIVRHLTEWSDDPIEQRNSLIVLLLFTTGMRRAELAGLKSSNVDLAQQKIRIIGKGSKEREIPLMPIVCKILERFLQTKDANKICENHENFVFLSQKGEAISTDEVYRVVSKILKEAGVQGKHSPHILRHTFATLLMNNQAPLRSIQELMGHKSLSSTQIYTHNTIERLKESYSKAHPRAQKDK